MGVHTRVTRVGQKFLWFEALMYSGAGLPESVDMKVYAPSKQAVPRAEIADVLAPLNTEEDLEKQAYDPTDFCIYEVLEFMTRKGSVAEGRGLERYDILHVCQAQRQDSGKQLFGASDYMLLRVSELKKASSRSWYQQVLTGHDNWPDFRFVRLRTSFQKSFVYGLRR